MRLSLKVKISLITVFVGLAALGLLLYPINQLFYKEYSSAVNSKTLAIGSGLKFQLERILLLGISLEQIEGFEKQCQEVVDKNKNIKYAMVINNEGKILFHSEGYWHYGGVIDNKKALDALEKNEEVVYIDKLDSVSYYNSLVPFADINRNPQGAIILGVPESNISDKIKNFTIFSLIMACISFGVGISLFVFFLSRWVIDPFNKLVSVIRDIRENRNLGKRVLISSRDEIGELAYEFNLMLESLEQSREDLENYGKNLEKQVEERTDTLNKKLQEIESTKNYLENTRKAILNILEDTDDTNKELLKTREELVKKVQELKVMDKKKDEFLSVTAHELKTPLTSIRGFAEILKDEKIMKNQKQRKKYFDIIIQDTLRLGKLITDILDLSRLDLGTMKFYFEKAGADEILNELKNLVDISIKSKGVASVYQAEKSIPVFYTDKSRLIQVLSNLVNNSIKYTEKGSIKVEAFKKDNYIHFRVTDSGTGIPQAEHKRLFRRFYQVDSSYTRKVGGSGLGLSICKGIVDALGGNIWFKSTVGKGSSFEFRIKFIERLEEKEVAKRIDKNVGSPGNALSLEKSKKK